MHSHTQRSSFRLVASCVVTLLALIGSASSVMSVQAQETTVSGCSLTGYPSASITIPPSGVVTDAAYTTIAVSSPSGFRYSDVSVGVGLYSAGADVPTYWAMVGDVVDIAPGAERVLDANIDMRSVAPGTYTMKAFVSQGGFDNVLAVAMRDGAFTPGVSIEKTGGATRVFDTEIVIDADEGEAGDYAPTSDAVVMVRTTNGSDRPIVDVNREVVITKGELPLGTAVVAHVTDAVKLLPGSVGASETETFSLISGGYTVYSTLVESDTFAVLERDEFMVDGDTFEEAFAYLPGVAVVGETGTGVEMVACVQTTDESGYQLDVPVALVASTGERTVFAGEGVLRDLRFVATYAEIEQGVDVRLEQQRPVEVMLGEDGSIVETSDQEVVFETVDSMSVSYECEEGSCGRAAEVVPVFDEATGGSSNTFYFYLGVVLASALLMYLMLRRMHPEEGASAHMGENELQ